MFGIGLAAYWPQFKGLKRRLEGYQRIVNGHLDKFCDVVDAGLVDSAPGAAAAGDLFAREGVELVICYVATYATSSQVLPAVQKTSAPVLILNLQPASALDYPRTDTGEWLANCCSCCVPEIACAFARSRIDFQVVTGVLGVERGRFREAPPSHPDSQRAWQEIQDWVRAASVVSRLKRSRIGFLGQTYPGMLDMYSDFTQHTAHSARTSRCWKCATSPSACPKPASGRWRQSEGRRCPYSRSARTARPIRWRARPNRSRCNGRAAWRLRSTGWWRTSTCTAWRITIAGLAGNEYERLGAGLILGCSLLTARGIPASGEGDLKNCQAMKMLDLLGCGGSYTEFYAMDFDEDFLLMGHDGPFHLGIAEGKPILRGLGLYHGKRGYGVSVEAHVKLGPVTLLALTQTADGRLKLLVSEGESVPGAMLQIGNTNSRIKFKGGMTNFVNRWCMEGPTHHCALGVGHVLSVVRRVAALLKLPHVEIG